jgi:DNA-directed RNA polymerase specialized sigma24 family protein
MVPRLPRFTTRPRRDSYPMKTLASSVVVTESTWEDTYERSFAQVFRGLLALGARPDEAEDALHDAFVKGIEGGDVSSPASWLFVTASRRWRRHRWRERLSRPFIRHEGLATADEFSGIEPFDALRKLPRRQREVLVARYIVRLSEEETARALGIAAGTVAATGMEAARELRSLMDPAMNDEFELWAVRAFDDAAPRIPLPRRDRWIPDKLTRAGEKLGAMLALAGVATLLVAVAVVDGSPARTGVGQPPNRPPTATPIWDLTQLPEAAQWGRVWSLSNGVAVLRPGWLPKSEAELQVFLSIASSNSALMSYGVSYYERQPRTSPGTIVWNIEFRAGQAPGPGLQQFGGLAETLTIRGQSAELYGNGSPGWTLVWSEGRYRYAIQAFAVSREDLLRIADSLAPVIDETGRTGS